jgi:hypothetical protein
VPLASKYSSKLGAGLGLITETKNLLEIWSEGMSTRDLHQAALDSGRFPSITARRLQNIITDCFAPRYLVDDGKPAWILKRLMINLSSQEAAQLFLLFTSRANPILGDFVRQTYWAKYIAGADSITNDDAREFVLRAIDDGKVMRAWSDKTIRNVSGYLTGCCGDFGLLEAGQRTRRRFSSDSKCRRYGASELENSNVGGALRCPLSRLISMNCVSASSMDGKSGMRVLSLFFISYSHPKISWK